MKRFLLTIACAFLSMGFLTSCQKESQSALDIAQELTTELKQVTNYQSAESSAARVEALNKRLQQALARPFAWNPEGAALYRSAATDRENGEGEKLSAALANLAHEIARVRASLPVESAEDAKTMTLSYPRLKVSVGAAKLVDDSSAEDAPYEMCTLPSPTPLPASSDTKAVKAVTMEQLDAEYNAYTGEKEVFTGKSTENKETAPFARSPKNLMAVSDRHRKGEMGPNDTPFASRPSCYGSAKMDAALKVFDSTTLVAEYFDGGEEIATPAKKPAPEVNLDGAEDESSEGAAESSDSSADETPAATPEPTPAPAADSDDSADDSSDDSGLISLDDDTTPAPAPADDEDDDDADGDDDGGIDIGGGLDF